MDRKVLFIMWSALCLFGCAKHAPSYEFKSNTIALREDYDYWLSHGRPTGLQPGEVAGTPEKYFVFTNIVTTTTGVLHCRFACREPGWPSGVLAITDNRLVIFIRQRDGKVIFSPDENGVEY